MLLYATIGLAPTSRAEVEFLHRSRSGGVVPVEEKNGRRTRGARNLGSYIDRYARSRAIKLVGGAGGGFLGPMEIWPLYDAQFLGDL